MPNQCETCLWYDKGTDEIYREGNDEDIIGDPNPNKHYCEEWNDNIIPKEIWHDKVKCPHYTKDPLIK